MDFLHWTNGNSYAQLKILHISNKRLYALFILQMQ